MKKKFTIAIIFLVTLNAFSQVGINTTVPYAQLEIKSSNQTTPLNTDGILIPKVDAFPITNPTVSQNGMLVFLTTTIGLKTPGFYYWDNATTSWIGIGSKSNWGLNGNSGTTATTNFIGTTDDNDIVFKRNSIRAGRIELGNTSFGVNSFNPLNTGISNTAFGDLTLSANTLGNYNTAIGTSALNANTIGTRNTAIGVNAMIFNLGGDYNTATGVNALRNNTDGDYNTAYGSYSLFTNSTGVQNTSTGSYAMYFNTIGNYNTAHGVNAMHNNIDGSENTATGDSALQANTHGSYNTAIGESALYSSVSGINNTAVGAYTLANGLLTGINNTAIGGGALNVTLGSDNTGLGYHAGINITSGSNNIAVGSNALVQSPTASDQLSVANVIYGTGMSSTASGKIGIGEPSPNAKLQISSSNQSAPANTDGILIPKVDAFPVTNPTAAQNGMMVFLTTAIGLKSPGFYYWDAPSTSWLGVGSKINWGLNGNSGTNPATNFIGTTDDADIVFKRFNTRVGLIQSTNIAFGSSALNPLNTGTNITAMGAAALYQNTSGGGNTAFGNYAMYANLDGNYNTATGDSALSFNTSGGSNTATGSGSLILNTLGNSNTGNGSGALGHNDSGNLNTADGVHSLFSNVSGSNNTAVGYSALGSSTGSNNVGLGYQSGTNITTGSNNIAIGTNAYIQTPTASDQLSIANVIYGTTLSSTALGKIGIGEPSPSAKLQISSSSQATPTNSDGIIIPKIDAFPATNPTVSQNGMMVFLTTTIGFKVPGFYYWDNATTSWIAIGTKSNWSLTGNSGTTIANNFIGTTDNTDVSIKTNNTEVMRLTASGKVGVGVAIPASELEVNGYTKLGSPAPAIKMLKFTGTTSAIQGNVVNIAHGVTSSKILGVTVLVDYAAGSSVPPSYNGSSGYEFDYYITTTNIVIWTKSGNSANILSKPIRILVTYEQ